MIQRWEDKMEKLISELGMDFELKPFLDYEDRHTVIENVLHKLLTNNQGRKLIVNNHRPYAYQPRFQLIITPERLNMFFRYYGIKRNEENMEEIAKDYGVSRSRIQTQISLIRQAIKQSKRTNIWYSFLDYS